MEQVEYCGRVTSYELRVGRFDGKFTQGIKKAVKNFCPIHEYIFHRRRPTHHSLLTTHHAPDQLPGKFPGLQSGFLLQNTRLLISETKLQRRNTRNDRNVMVSYRTCDGVRENMGRLEISPGFFLNASLHEPRNLLSLILPGGEPTRSIRGK